MANRIPPSLNWLIDKRARLAAEVEKTKKSIAEANRLIVELRGIEADLDAIDRSIKLHSLNIDISNIDPINSQYVRINLPHGELTKSIYLCLRLREGKPTKFSDIVSFIIARHADLAKDEMEYVRLRRLVHYRLKGLAQENRIERIHCPKSNKEGVWALPGNQ